MSARQVLIGFEPSESQDVIGYKLSLFESGAWDDAVSADPAVVPEPDFTVDLTIFGDKPNMVFDEDRKAFMVELNQFPAVGELDGTYHVMINAVDDAGNESEGTMEGYVELDFLAPSAPPRVFVVRL